MTQSNTNGTAVPATTAKHCAGDYIRELRGHTAGPSSVTVAIWFLAWEAPRGEALSFIGRKSLRVGAHQKNAEVPRQAREIWLC